MVVLVKEISTYRRPTFSNK